MASPADHFRTASSHLLDLFGVNKGVRQRTRSIKLVARREPFSNGFSKESVRDMYRALDGDEDTKITEVRICAAVAQLTTQTC
jgi:hypothetical protein